ncbi:MAG TPA: hypothetical protein VF207_02230, partial [Chthoniobacterales bacterium]
CHETNGHCGPIPGVLGLEIKGPSQPCSWLSSFCSSSKISPNSELFHFAADSDAIMQLIAFLRQKL